MKIKTLVLTAIFGAGILFQSCEKDKLQAPSDTPSVDTEAANKVTKNNKNDLLTERELENYVYAMEEESAILINEINPGQYSVEEITFNPGNSNSTPNGDSVFPDTNRGFKDAMMEAIRMSSDGVPCVTIERRYGSIAVNGYDAPCN